jgi:hypothetical protein
LLDSSSSHVTSGGTRTAVAMAEEGTTGITAPTTLEALAQMSCFSVGAGVQNRCRIRVPSGQLLRRGLKWWLCSTTDSPSFPFVSQGSLWWMYDNDASWSGVGGVITAVIEGVCEFQGMTVSGVGLKNPSARVSIHQRTVTHTEEEENLQDTTHGQSAVLSRLPSVWEPEEEKDEECVVHVVGRRADLPNPFHLRLCQADCEVPVPLPKQLAPSSRL